MRTATIRSLSGAQAVIATAVGVLLVAAASLPSCFSQGETTCGQENEPLAPLRGRLIGDVLVRDDAGNAVRDDAGDVIPVYAMDDAGAPVLDGAGNPVIRRGPQPGSTVFVELCGIYSANPDPAKGHPNYRYGAITREDGTFELMVPRGKVGLHTFNDGWFYGRTEIEDAPVRVAERPEFVEAAARRSPGPVLSQFAVRPAQATAGQELSFSVQAKSAGRDPMSEEVVLFETRSGAARALAPPRRGVPKKGWPDGRWTATMSAPREPGRYTYIVQSTSEFCVSSNRLSLDVVVQ